jgi:DNA-damage-inducible protein D
MTPIELIFTALSEESTRIIAKSDDAIGFAENHNAAQRGGNIAGTARRRLEKESGEKIVSSSNFLKLLLPSEEEEKPQND